MWKRMHTNEKEVGESRAKGSQHPGRGCQSERKEDQGGVLNGKMGTNASVKSMFEKNDIRNVCSIADFIDSRFSNFDFSILDISILEFRYSTFRYWSFDTRHFDTRLFDTRVSILDISILQFRYSKF